MATKTVISPVTGKPEEVAQMYANCNFSITADQQAAWQIWLRMLPDIFRTEGFGGKPPWKMLHDLSYAESWTAEATQPVYGEDE